MSIDQVLLEHRDAHQSEERLGLHLRGSAELVSSERDQMPTELRTVLIWPFIEKVYLSLT